MESHRPEMNGEAKATQRRLRDRLLHATAEVLLSFVLAAGLFFGLYRLMCHYTHSCDNFGGVAFAILSFLMTLFVWGWFLSLCRTFRHRLAARIRLDAIAAFLTLSVWAAFLLS